jgi:CDP-diacylglycerol--serine O-phosphatidyltransferase
MTVFPQHPATMVPRGKRRRLKSLAFVPSLLTLGNLICGFAAIHFAMRAMHEFGAGISDDQIPALKVMQLVERLLPSSLLVGAGLVMAGMILDAFDGLVARVTRSASNFGTQLDSLADVVTFGVAPATLMVAFMTRELATDAILPSPVSEHFLGRAAWVSAAVYVAFAAIRLARYNAEHARDDFDYRTFRGLPTPGAAAFIVAVLLFHQTHAGPLLSGIIVYCMPAAVMATAFLMVSRVPYRRFYRAYLLGRQPFGHFLVLVTVLAIFWAYSAATLFVLVMWYWLSGPAEWVIRLFRGGPFGHAQPAGAPAAESERRLA